MLDARSIATLGIGYGAAHVARIGLLGVTVVVPPDVLPGGHARPGRRTRRRETARADVRLQIGCTIAAAARLEISAAAAVDLDTTLKSAATLRLSASAAVAQPLAVESVADIHDVLLEILTMA